MADKKKAKKKTMKIVDATSFLGSGASDDWIRAGRLKEKAAAGDKAAAKELAEMEDSEMVMFDDL